MTPPSPDPQDAPDGTLADLTTELCETLLALAAGHPPRDIATVTLAARLCAHAWHLPLSALYAPHRLEPASTARQAAMTLALAAGVSSTRVAPLFHRRDHSTALWAAKQIRARAAKHPHISARLRDLTTRHADLLRSICTSSAA